MYDINKMKLHYIDLHVQQLQVRFLLLLFFWGGALFVFFFNLSYGPSLWSILVTLNDSTYTWIFSHYNWPFEQTLSSHIHSQPTTHLTDLYRGYNSFWFICEQIFSDTTARGVVADQKVGGNVGKWVQTSWGDGKVEGKALKLSKLKSKKKVFRLQTPLITSWFRENLWLNATNSAFSKSLHKNVGRQKHFLKGGYVAPPFFAPCSCLG